MSDSKGLAIDLVGKMTGYQGSALIGTAVETGLADALAGGPATAGELAVGAGVGDDPGHRDAAFAELERGLERVERCRAAHRVDTRHAAKNQR